MELHATTILTVRHQGRVAMAGDGQVTLGTAVMKSDAVKIRRLADGSVLCGFAGGSADAFALLERFEAKLKDYPANVPRAATELAKDWRTDRILRRLEALLAVADAEHSLADQRHGRRHSSHRRPAGHRFRRATMPWPPRRALRKYSNLTAAEIARESLLIAAGIDIYTNTNIVVEELVCKD